MKLMISGHRKSKLKNYSEEWIKITLEDILYTIPQYRFKGDKLIDEIIGLSGMADGIDLWFCELLLFKNVDYWACIPFEEQDEYMSEEYKKLRKHLVENARRTLNIRNSQMVEQCDKAIVVWDGNKGGTHNVFQQLVEKKKDFWWINPVKETVIKC